MANEQNIFRFRPRLENVPAWFRFRKACEERKTTPSAVFNGLLGPLAQAIEEMTPEQRVVTINFGQIVLPHRQS